MTTHHQLSLPMAILININIMLGAGIFINTTVLSQRAGALGGIGYIIIGLLMLPLVLSITELLKMHPAGGFYTFGAKEINPFAGFISSWAYFTGKLASAVLMIHSCVLLVQQIIPLTAHAHPLLIDTAILTLFTALNMKNIKTGSTIQAWFIGFKMVPIVFLLLTGLFLFDGTNLSAPYQIWSGIPSILPLVLYATVGFEAACSLSSKIRDAHKNAPRAVLISYSLVVLIACSFQLMFYGALGSLFNQFTDYRDAFPALLHALLPTHAALGNSISRILHLGIAASALGGSYGILFSNSWNLHTLAQHGHTFAQKLLTQYNQHHIPWICVVIESLICILYLGITQGTQVTLQQLGALGCILSYSVSALALIYAKINKKTELMWFIPLLGFANCIVLTISCVHSLMINGSTSLIIFCCLLIAGAVMFKMTQEKSLTQLERN
jgi:amino acid transporter